LRAVEVSDADLLLAWANDPGTRRSSFHPAPIERAGHLEWLAGRLASPTTAFWVGESDGRAVGQVRLEQLADGVAEVSIAVAPEVRGAGIGRELLAAAVAAAGRALPVHALLARVRADNPPSIALFDGLGFRERGQSTCNGIPCIEYELELRSI
jgi:RimJ/RimL family protein N-acetyltransferase